MDAETKALTKENSKDCRNNFLLVLSSSDEPAQINTYYRTSHYGIYWCDCVLISELLMRHYLGIFDVFDP